jgi:hypothetical protein
MLQDLNSLMLIKSWWRRTELTGWGLSKAASSKLSKTCKLEPDVFDDLL